MLSLLSWETAETSNKAQQGDADEKIIDKEPTF